MILVSALTLSLFLTFFGNQYTKSMFLHVPLIINCFNLSSTVKSKRAIQFDKNYPVAIMWSKGAQHLNLSTCSDGEWRIAASFHRLNPY